MLISDIKGLVKIKVNKAKEIDNFDDSFEAGKMNKQIKNLKRQETSKSSMYQKNKFTKQHRPEINDGDSSDEINSKFIIIHY